MIDPRGQGNWIWIRMIIIANLLLDIAAIEYAHLWTELASEGWYWSSQWDDGIW